MAPGNAVRPGADRPVDLLAAPAGVAVFGASADPRKLGHLVARSVLTGGYPGRLELVNPRGGSALGRPLVPVEAAHGVDVAVLATPAHTVAGLVERCADLAIPVAVVCAGGLEERTGPLARRLSEVAAATGVRVVGPASIGVYCSANGLNTTTLPDLPEGGVAFVSQSGGLGYHVGRRLRHLGSGYDLFLSLGAAHDVGFVDALRTVAARPAVRSVLLYLESLAGGDSLLAQIAQVSAQVPVVALLGGVTDRGGAAARSHTSAVLPEPARARALLAAAGAHVADSLSTAVAAAAALRTGGGGRRERVFVLADGGGAAVTATDALVRAGLRVPAPSRATAGRLAALLSLADLSVADLSAADLDPRDGEPLNLNPLEFAGRAERDLGLYPRVLRVVGESGEYDAVLLAGVLGGYATLNGPEFADGERRILTEIVRVAAGVPIPVVVQSPFLDQPGGPLRASGLGCVEWPEEAAALLAGGWSGPAASGGYRASGGYQAPTTPDPARAADLTAAHDQVAKALDRAGIAHLLGESVTLDALPANCDSLNHNGRWVLRLPGLAHKVVAGGIRLALSPADLPSAYRELRRLALHQGVVPDVRLAPFVAVDAEILVTLWRTDGAAGLVLGTGGGAAGSGPEADLVTGVGPRDPAELDRLFARTRVSAAVEGPARAALLILVGRLVEAFMTDLDWLAELECNPVVVGPDGVFVADVLATPLPAALPADTGHG